MSLSVQEPLSQHTGNLLGVRVDRSTATSEGHFHDPHVSSGSELGLEIMVSQKCKISSIVAAPGLSISLSPLMIWPEARERGARPRDALTRSPTRVREEDTLPTFSC